MGALEESEDQSMEKTPSRIVTVEANETMITGFTIAKPAILAPRDYQEYLENENGHLFIYFGSSQTMK